MRRLMVAVVILWACLLGLMVPAETAWAAMMDHDRHAAAPVSPCPDHAPQGPAQSTPLHALACCVLACLSAPPDIGALPRRPALPRAGLGIELLARNPAPCDPPPRLSPVQA